MKYYVDLTNEDYMTAGGEPIGKWFGFSAEILGLRGRVESEPFKNVMNGFSPDGHSALVQNAGDKDRQRGWDCVFSVPKSLSTLWSQADPATRALIELSHREAVEEALRFEEQKALWTRRGHAGVSREQVGMCAAIFEHGTSRSGDPCLHSHVVIASVCVREDGTTGTILSKPLFTHKMVTGAIYRACLGAQLKKNLGLSLTRRGTHLFEVAGVSPILVRTFSKRREAIERMLRVRQETGPIAASRAAILTRPSKSHIPRQVLFNEWRSVGARMGWSTKDAERLRDRATSPIGEIEIKDIRAAITQLTDFQAHFTLRDLTRAIADQIQAKGFSAAHIERAVAHAATKLFPLGMVYGDMHFTTRATLRSERALFARVIEGQHSGRHIVSERIVGEIIGSGRLSQEQKSAVKHITTTPGQVKLVSGLAGTGKSSMIDAARQAWEKGGLRVVGVALTGKAAESLQRSSGIQSFTLASVLIQTNQPIISAGGLTLSQTRSPIAPKAPHWSPVNGLTLPHLTFGVGGVNGTKIDHRTVVVVDEAGLVGTRQMTELIQRLTAARAKVVLVGDPKQLPPIEAGAPFQSLSQRMNHATLGEIKRQEDPWARQVVRDLATGESRRAIDELEARGRIHVERNKEEAVARLVNDWKRAGPPERNLILASTREEVSLLNQECQQRRLRSGELKPVFTEHKDICIHPGDRVVFEANSKQFGVNNGSFGQVLHVSGDDLIVKLDSGSKVTVPLDRYPHVGLGYAITSHKAQGLTCDNAFCYVSPDFMGREMAYVQASRARSETHLYLDEATAGKDLQGLNELFKPGRLKMMAHDLLPDRGKARDGAEPRIEQRDPKKPDATHQKSENAREKREKEEKSQREERARIEAAEKERQRRKAEDDRAREQRDRLRRENERGR